MEKAIFKQVDTISEHRIVGFKFRIKCEKCDMSIPQLFKILINFYTNGSIEVIKDERDMAMNFWNTKVGEQNEQS